MKINIVLNRLPTVSETFLVNWIKYLSLNNQIGLVVVETRENFLGKEVAYLGKVKIIGKFNLFVWLKSIKLFFEFCDFRLSYRIAHLTVDSPEIIHFSYSALAVSRIEELKKIKRNNAIKTIVSCRGTSENVKPFIFKERGELLKELFQIVDLTHCVSDNLRESMRRNFGLSMHRSFTNRPAINLHNFPFGINEFNKDQTISILSIGRLNYIKGYFFAFEAMSKLKNLGVKFKYNIIGDGPLYEEMLFYRHQFDLVDEVNLLGIKEGEDVVSELKNSNVLLLPSLSEGIANVVLEAMAVGVFVISTNVGGMNEVIVNEETGLVINSYSSSEIVDAILWIGENPNRFNPIKEAARLKIEKDFSIERQILVFNGEYQKLMGNV